ncbi:MAG: hypothetical protein ACE5IL_15640, partial [Myxococcota bacterium]
MAAYSITKNHSTLPLKRISCADEEQELQQLLEKTPDLLPGEQIQPDDPCRWLLIRRELPVPDPATGSNRWSIDHVFADQHAIPTLVECKRFLDSRARREVVGQILEYAANGPYYWSADEMLQYASQTATRAGQSLEESLTSLDPSVDASPEEFFSAFVENLREGRLRLVFFMEQAPAELKSIVEFLNRQMERSEVLVVEARQYELDGRRIVIPSLFGFTEEARRAKRIGGRDPSHRAWDEESFLASARQVLSVTGYGAVERLLRFCRDQQFEIRWGMGKQVGSFSVVVSEISRRASFAVFT